MRQPYHNQSVARQPVSLAGSRSGLRHLGAALLLALATGSAYAQQRPVPNFFAPDAATRTAASSPLAATLVRAQALSLYEPGLRAAKRCMWGRIIFERWQAFAGAWCDHCPGK